MGTKKLAKWSALVALLALEVFLLGGCVSLQQPKAVLRAAPTSGNAPLVVAFDLSNSSDPNPDGAIVSFELQFGDGSPAVTGQDVATPITHTYSDDGYYTAVLVVTNVRDNTGHAKAHISVTNPGPQAGFTHSPENPEIGESVLFNACDLSLDPASARIKPQSIITYEWDFGDGSQAFSQDCTVFHSYADTGSYPVVLAIYDDDGVRDTDSQSITVAYSGFYAYVANSGDDTVSVIRTSDNTVVGDPIGVGDYPTGIAITPDGSYVYVANMNSYTVSVIRTSDNTVVETITVGKLPYGIAITTPDGSYAYVTNSGDGTVSVIQTSVNTVVDTISISIDAAPHGIAITPNGDYAYVVNSYDGAVSVIQTSVNTVVGDPIDVGKSPMGIAITPDGAYAYVTKVVIDGTVSVIRTSDNTVVGLPIAVGAVPYGVAITPDGAYVYVVNRGGTVSVIQTSDNTVVGLPIGVGAEPEPIAITPDGLHAYVGNQGGNTVSVIRTLDNTVVKTITVGLAPRGIAIRPH
jgi:YVTN family beta-propeller protein